MTAPDAKAAMQPVDWQAMPEERDEIPYDGLDVLLALPNLLPPQRPGQGTRYDGETPFVIYTAYWNRDEQRWFHRLDRGHDEPIDLNPAQPPLWARR